MSDESPSLPRRPKPQHIVRVVHTGSKHLTSNFDSFHLPPPSDQMNRYQPQRDAGLYDTEFASATPANPRWKRKDMRRDLEVDQLERHMDICLAWEGETILEVTTYRKPAGQTLYLKINRITHWADGYKTAPAMYEPSLEVFQSTSKQEQWKTDVLRVVYREDDRAWWHVQERMWRDRLQDPYNKGWKPAEPTEHVVLPHQQKAKRKLPWPTEEVQEMQEFDGQGRTRLAPVVKRKRKLPWRIDNSAQKTRKSVGSKQSSKEQSSKKQRDPWNSGVDTLSAWFRSRGEMDPDDEEASIDIEAKIESNRPE